MGGIATIGTGGFEPEELVGALTAAAVGVVLDVRGSCGARGADGGWTTPARLRAALAETGIEYRRLEELSPQLGRAYADQVLDPADLTPLVELARRTLPALLCVDRAPESCLRTLLSARLEAEQGLTVVQLRPFD